MYQRRLSQTIVSSQHNLKSLLLENKHSLMIRQKFNDMKSIKEMNKKLQDMIKNGKLYKMLTRGDTSNCDNVLKVWVYHCECVFAQRLRRCQQMFCLYSKWWEERALREFIRKMKQTLAKKGKEFALGAIGISAYNWEEHRISDDNIKEHSNEIDYIYKLKDNTICSACTSTDNNEQGNEANSAICRCGTSKKSNKTYDDWTLFIEKNDLIVWRRLHPSGQYEYKVYGSYNDVSAEDFLNVQVDTDYRRKWDTTAVMLEVAETESNSNSDIIYWEMLWPRLFVNRDYVFNRRYLVDKDSKMIYLLSKSTEHPHFPKYPEKYRIEDYWSCMVIKPYGEMNQPGIEFSLSYFDNPGVNIPSSVTTWVAMRAMPDFLERLREATKKYKEYCRKEGVTKACKVMVEEERAREELMHKDALEYCTFKSPENVKLKAPHVVTNAVNKMARPSDRYDSNSGNINRNIDNNSSDTDSPPTSTAVQSENGNFWKYLHPLYYFH